MRSEERELPTHCSGGEGRGRARRLAGGIAQRMNRSVPYSIVEGND
jgi:hypothetical protein